MEMSKRLFSKPIILILRNIDDCHYSELSLIFILKNLKDSWAIHHLDITCLVCVIHLVNNENIKKIDMSIDNYFLK